MAKTGFTPAMKGTYTKEVELPGESLGLPFTDPPTIEDQDNVSLYKFTLDTDKLTHDFELPEDYHSGDINIAVMWTNDGGVDDNGKFAKWQLDYQTAAMGDAVSGDHANSPKDTEDAYASDSGWIEHHTAAMTIAAADFAGKHHILLKLSAVTPAGTALTCEPHLICLCITYTAIWGRK